MAENCAQSPSGNTENELDPVSYPSSATSLTQSSFGSDSSRSDPPGFAPQARKYPIKRWHARRPYDLKAANVLQPHQLNRLVHEAVIQDGESPFVIYDPAFHAVLGESSCLRLLATTAPELGANGVALFHEAGVWLPHKSTGRHIPTEDLAGGEIWFTSNLIPSAPSQAETGLSYRVEISRVSVPAEESPPSHPCVEKDHLIESPKFPGVLVHKDCSYDLFDQTGLDFGNRIVMANGGMRYGDSAILFCAQGQDHYIANELSETTQPRDPSLPRQCDSKGSGSLPGCLPGGLVLFEPLKPRGSQVTPILNNFHLRRFNSPNDVTAYPPQPRFVFFTDPDYGHEQGFKTKPMLPNSVWRFDELTGTLCMMDDSLKKPNGICFNPSGTRCYVTDTDFISGDGSVDGSRAATIYEYEVHCSSGKPMLRSRTIFAFIDCGCPDGIKCDQSGNVYAGCFDGVNVFDSTGCLIGKIVLPRNLIDSQGKEETGRAPQRGCANLVFTPNYDRLFILSETTLWEVRFGKNALTRPDSFEVAPPLRDPATTT